MSRGVLLLALALCAATAVSANDERLPLTPEAISEAFKGFTTELANVMDQDQKHGRSLLTFNDDFHGFLSGLMGKDWSSFVPDAWKGSDFGWGKLLPFDLKHSIADFLDSSKLDFFSKPHSLLELHDTFETILDDFCKPWKFTPPAKTDPFCQGPSVTLAYNPKICIVDESRKQIICTPASITIEKTPGICVKKMITPATFTGKSCSITKTVGVEVEVDIGNQPFVIDLDKFFPGTDPLKELDWNKKVDKLQKFHEDPSPPPPASPPPAPAPVPAPEPAPVPGPIIT